jgi:hypothetical protein
MFLHYYDKTTPLNLRFHYDKLNEDTDLTPEAKSWRTEELYEQHSSYIESFEVGPYRKFGEQVIAPVQRV